MVPKPWCEVSEAASEKQKCSESSKGQGPDISAFWNNLWEWVEKNGGNKFPWGSFQCSLDFFDFSSNWRLKTGDEFGLEWG